MYADADDFPIRCHHCEHEIAADLGALRANQPVQCDLCGTSYVVESPDQLAWLLSEAGRLDLERYFAGFKELKFSTK